MSENGEEGNVEQSTFADSDQQETSDDEYDDDNFDDFMNDDYDWGASTNFSIADGTVDEFLNFLRLGMDFQHAEKYARDIMVVANADVANEKVLGRCIVDFVLQCTASIVEFGRRMNIIREVFMVWPDHVKHTCEVINKQLADTEHALGHVKSRNLAYFIRCLHEDNHITSQDIEIPELGSSLETSYDHSVRSVLGIKATKAH